jgi:pilus assembly protein CpaF
VAHALIAQALDFVVFVKKNPSMGARRCVTEILEVTGVTDGRVASSAIFPTSPVTGRAHRDHQVQIRRGKDLAEFGYGYGFDDAPGWAPAAASGWLR